ncbi:MAG: transposase [Thermodesulfobacteriota bacterium]
MFLHQCHGWKKARRFVAIRKLVAVQTEGVFFPMPQYEFFCYVTNLPHAPWHIHKLYGQRATSENWISWCKSQMASGTIRTGVFWANSAIFQSCILAYNLMVWMMWLTSEKSFHEEPEQSFLVTLLVFSLFTFTIVRREMTYQSVIKSLLKVEPFEVRDETVARQINHVRVYELLGQQSRQDRPESP